MVDENNGHNDTTGKPDTATGNGGNPAQHPAANENSPAGNATSAAARATSRVRAGLGSYHDEHDTDEDAHLDESEESPGLGPDLAKEHTQRTAEDVITALNAENRELKDSVLRAMAETENLRKRMEREVASAAKYSISSFAKDVTTLIDNFQRALGAVPEDQTADNPALKGLRDGVVMIEAEFIKVMDRNGIKRTLPEKGKDLFDPNVHQAVSQLQDTSVPAGTITEVLQPGFVLDSRVLRPAIVIVAQGGPKPVKASPTAESQAAEATDANAVDAPDEPPASGTEGQPGS